MLNTIPKCRKSKISDLQVFHSSVFVQHRLFQFLRVILFLLRVCFAQNGGLGRLRLEMNVDSFVHRVPGENLRLGEIDGLASVPNKVFSCEIDLVSSLKIELKPNKWMNKKLAFSVFS